MVPTSSSIAAASRGGRVAVVTGSNQGIGFFIALQLALSGKFGNIILACRDPSRGLEAMKQIESQLIDSTSPTSPTTTNIFYEPFTLGDPISHSTFCQKMKDNFGKVDVLVNNAAIAYKGSDPTPFMEQTKPTLDINFRATVDFTEQLLPLLRQGIDPRIVNVSSMSGKLSQVSKSLQKQFSSSTLTILELQNLMNQFESDVKNGIHQQKGWSNSNYGISKLGITAVTKIWARQEAKNGISINCCCPGYCSTSMSSYRGSRLPEEGAKNAVIPAIMDNPPTGQYFANFQIAEW